MTNHSLNAAILAKTQPTAIAKPLHLRLWLPRIALQSMMTLKRVVVRRRTPATASC
jgi:hypothetical protein